MPSSHARRSQAFTLNIVLPVDADEPDHTVHTGGHIESEETLSPAEEKELVAF